MTDVSHLKKEVERALSEVIDPETGLSITRMDLIHDLSVTDEGQASLVFRPSSPVCPMAYALAHSIKQRVEGVSGIRKLQIRIENYQRASHLEGLLNTIE